MRNLFVTYVDITPNFGNPFSNFTHKVLVEKLRKHFARWDGFFEKYKDYSLGFIICTKYGTENLEIKGPSISRKLKIVDFSVFLPDEIKNESHYLDFVFSGIELALTEYKVLASEILDIKNECKRELNIIN